MDILKALQALADAGIELTPEQSAQMLEFKETALREGAEKIISGKLLDDAATDGSGWTTHLFDLAREFADDFKGSNVGRGRGEVHERVVRVETPYGSLKVSLTNEPTAE